MGYKKLWFRGESGPIWCAFTQYV